MGSVNEPDRQAIRQSSLPELREWVEPYLLDAFGAGLTFGSLLMRW